MTSLLHTPKTSRRSEPYQLALEAWRRQARLVADLWATYRVATREGQAIAFRAYMAALDDEEAAATELAGLALARVA
ncbi:MAG TPA: hypothetical protein VF066_04960 [Thermoleophilaceae bacterium]